MRIKSYKVRILDSTIPTNIVVRDFDMAQARSVGGYLIEPEISDNPGIELKDALRLVNKWNREAGTLATPRYIYWIEE